VTLRCTAARPEIIVDEEAVKKQHEALVKKIARIGGA